MRFLIDRELGNCYNGIMSYDNLHKVIAAYNGPGGASKKYADHAMANLNLAMTGKGT